jgi:hypothetical protein
MADPTAAALVQSYEDWIQQTPEFKSNLLSTALLWALSQTGVGGGGTSIPSASTSSVSSVNASAVSVALAPASVGRIGLAIYNGGSTDLYLSVGTAAASAALATLPVSPGGYYELPQGWAALAVQGIWAGSPTGAAWVTAVA